MKYLTLLAASATLACAAGSGVRTMDRLGEENWPVNTAEWSMGGAGSARTKDGVSLLNPARGAFDTQTRFAATLRTGWTWFAPAESKGDLTSAYSLPTVSFNVPLGLYGSLGASFWQRYSKNLAWEEGDTLLEYSGGLFELVPHASVRGPGMARNFSVGGAWHVVTGRDTRKLDATWIPQDSSWSNFSSGIRQVEVTTASYEADGFVGGYGATSLHYHGKRLDLTLGAHLPHDLIREVSYQARTTGIDTLFPVYSTDVISVPILLGTGVLYRIGKRHSLALDYWQRDWSKNEPEVLPFSAEPGPLGSGVQSLASIGYQIEGSGYAYDGFFARNSFRTGMWWAQPGYQDVQELGMSVGAGFPVGRRGARLDFGLRGGVRGAGEGSLAEPADRFWDVGVTLVGVGAWGESQRRRR